MKPRLIDTLAGALDELASAQDGAVIPTNFTAILEEVAHGIDDISVTRHPLGFMHFEVTPLVPTIEHQRVRLHLWTQESMRWTDDLGSIHDHSWVLNSLVLLGGLTDTVLNPVPSADGPFVAARVTYADGGLTLDAQDGAFELEVERSREVLAGHSYRLPPGLLHSTEVKKVPTATLVQAVTTSANSALVFRRRDAAMKSSTQRLQVPKSESIAALELAIRGAN